MSKAACWDQHAEIKRDASRWSQLELVGHQVQEADQFGPREVTEIRNCTCGSTLGVVVRDQEAP